MPYDLHWHDDEHTIIRLDMHGQVTWDAWYVAVDNICAELEQASHRVDIIFHDMTGMPKGNPMPHMKVTMTKLNSQEHIGTIVSVTRRNQSAFIKTIVEMVTRLMQLTSVQKGVFVESLDEAVAYIHSEREKLNTSVEQ